MNKVTDKQISPVIRVRVSVILQRNDGRVCFVRHNKNGKIYWLLPGGGQDPFESATETARRELREELKLELSGNSLQLAFIRESFNAEIGRHIQFLVFKGECADFDSIAVGEDERVEGYDFFDAEELGDKPVYPAIKEDIFAYLNDKDNFNFKTLEWIP